jgi:hypothetical protein
MSHLRSLLLLSTLLAPVGLAAQVAASGEAAALGPQARLRLFLDCQHCDKTYLRSEVTVVDWVTDKEASDIHLIVTFQQTGAGGYQMSLDFIGRGPVEALTDRITYQNPPDISSEDSRAEMARMIQLGLVRYLVRAGRGRGLRLQMRQRGEGEITSLPTNDPWNFWVFQVKVDGQYDAESKENGTEIETEFNADRVTEDWKIDFRIKKTIDRNTYELDDGTEIKTRKDSWYGSGEIVRSLGPKWSFGLTSSWKGAETENIDLRIRVAPAIEYDVFPYAMAHRRRLILRYTLGINSYDYVEETVYGELKETRLDHRLQVAYRTKETWGDANLSGTAEAYASDLAQNRLSVKGGFDIRLAKGLSLNMSGSYSKVKNQITLPKGDASDEEVFLDLRDRATDYKAEMKFGLSYRFGSFLNSIVNPRFDHLD